MAKIRANVEKRLRNEAYAKRFEKEDDQQNKPKKKGAPKDALYANWCRIEGHPHNCKCVY